MYFQIIHTHTEEHCPGLEPQAGARLNEWWESFKSTEGVKVHLGTLAPLSHTFYMFVETEDYGLLVKALAYLNSIGSGQIVPVAPLDAGMGMVKEGVFYTNK